MEYNNLMTGVSWALSDQERETAPQPPRPRIVFDPCQQHLVGLDSAGGGNA